MDLKTLDALDEKVRTLRAEQVAHLEQARRLDDAIRAAVTEREHAANEYVLRPPAEVGDDLEEISGGQWMDAAQYAECPLDVRVMILDLSYLSVTESGAVRDAEEGLRTWDDLRGEYARWHKRRG